MHEMALSQFIYPQLCMFAKLQDVAVSGTYVFPLLIYLCICAWCCRWHHVTNCETR